MSLRPPAESRVFIMEINSASNLYSSFDSASVGKYSCESASEGAEKKASEAARNSAENDAFTPSPKDGGAAEPSLNVKSADLFKAVHKSSEPAGSGAARKEAAACGETGEPSESAKKEGGLLKRVIGAIKPEAAFTVTNASECEKGGDAAELAHKLSRERYRSSANLENFTLLKANDKDNVIKLSQDGKGFLHVSVDGKETYFSPKQAERLIIDGGGGDDCIIADQSVTMSLHIVGGKGNDRIEAGGGSDYILDNYGSNYILAGGGDDRVIANQLDFGSDTPAQTVQTESGAVSVSGNYIDGGDGDDFIEGGRGGDYLAGGKGNDVIYGLDGGDIISGGEGRDYIDGGSGGDTIYAGAGNDIIFGGAGDDTVKGEAGDNLIVGGRGQDSIDSGSGRNRIITDGADAVAPGSDTPETVAPMDIPANISVEGDEGFKMHAQSDLEALASVPVSQRMLNGLADMKGHQAKITDTDGGNFCSNSREGRLKSDGTANEGADSRIGYNRTRIKAGHQAWSERAPIVGLYHEMAHAYDAGNGIMDNRMYNYEGSLAAGTLEDPGDVKGCELQAVGIDIGSKDLPLNPDGISENSLREFLGYERRDEY